MTFYYKPQTYNGRWLPVSWDGPIPEQKALTNEDIKALATKYNIPYAHLKAVVEVESAGSGFLLDEAAPARPKILYERTYMYKLSPKPVSRTRPDLSGPTWDRDKKYYVGGSGEWRRLQQAAWFDEENALKSASWGLMQVMGNNAKLAGRDSIQQFVIEEFTGEKEQLVHGLEFIKNAGLLDELRDGRWTKFAEGYNGKAQAKHHYDVRLKTAAENIWERIT